MDCSKAQTYITLYIQNKLSRAETEEFLTHIAQCPSCMDDLEVNYSLFTAMEQMNRGEDLSDDYTGELHAKIAAFWKDSKQRRHKALRQRILYVAAAIVFGLYLGVTSTYLAEIPYLPEGEASSLRLAYYGIPQSHDPVYRAIEEHNSEVIEYLRSLQ